MKFCSSTPLSILLILTVTASWNLDTVASFFINDSYRSTTRTVVPIKSGTPPSCCTPKLTAESETNEVQQHDEYDDSPKLTAVGETNEVQQDEYDDFFDDFDPSDYEEATESGYGDKYARDIDADDSDVDLETVTELIAKRSEMKRTRQFDEADKIRDELLVEYGILVRDNDRKWRTGCSQSQNHSKWLHGDTLKPRGDFKSRDDFGPNGHDYALASDAGPSIASISEEKIHELLAKRLSCKFDRDYDGADAIQAELLSAGVVIDGKAREWRADGQFFSNFAPREYKMSPHNCDISDDLDEVEKLLWERSLARAERLFKRSDEIRDELLERFDVRINDNMLLWSVGGGQNWGKADQPPRYTMSDRSKVPSEVDEIEKLVQKRDNARLSRDFGKADEIRDQLLDKNIIVDDKKKIWYVGKMTKPPGRDVLNSKDYIRRGGGDLSEEKLNEIEGLVNKRDGHKRNRQFKDADDIRAGLLKDYGVQVDDGNREWYIISTAYCMAHDSAEIDEETRSKVQQKIQDRTLARSEKDYEKADTIKKVLFKKYNVAIDDRTKEWSVINREN